LDPGGRPTGRRPRTGIADDFGGAAIAASPASAAEQVAELEPRLRLGVHATAAVPHRSPLAACN